MEDQMGTFYKIVGWPLYWILTLSGADRLIKLNEKADAYAESEFKSDAADLKRTLQKLRMDSYSVFGPAQCAVCKEAARGLIYISFADKQMSPCCVACARVTINLWVEHVGGQAPYPVQT